jgi:hypothetical protein
MVVVIYMLHLNLHFQYGCPLKHLPLRCSEAIIVQVCTGLGNWRTVVTGIAPPLLGQLPQDPHIPQFPIHRIVIVLQAFRRSGCRYRLLCITDLCINDDSLPSLFQTTWVLGVMRFI